VITCRLLQLQENTDVTTTDTRVAVI
jgi:hypothetical protein